MEVTPPPAALDASFDLVNRQDAADKAIEAIRSDVDEVKSRLDRVSRAAARPALDGSAPQSPEVKSFVDGYLRHGRIDELKSLTGAVPGDGGYAVPHEIDVLIAARLKALSPIRAIAQVVQTGTAGYRKLIATGGAASGWVSEIAARPETATPVFAEIIPPAGELYANPAASQAMLDDAVFDLQSWLADEIAMEFARAEGAAFVNGSGTNQPKGFLGAPTSTAGDASRTFGTLQHVASGNASTLGSSPELTLIDLVHTLKPGHRQNATWVMNSVTLAEVRKLKATDGSFIWQPGLLDGQPDRLLGYPVVEAADMPDIAADALPIAFGNFQAGYLIAERNATAILRDPFTNKPFVHFYATKRIGGQVLDSDAIKLLKISCGRGPFLQPGDRHEAAYRHASGAGAGGARRAQAVARHHYHAGRRAARRAAARRAGHVRGVHRQHAARRRMRGDAAARRRLAAAFDPAGPGDYRRLRRGRRRDPERSCKRRLGHRARCRRRRAGAGHFARRSGRLRGALHRRPRRELGRPAGRLATGRHAPCRASASRARVQWGGAFAAGRGRGAVAPVAADAPDMIRAQADTGFVARLTARARALGDARAERQALARTEDARAEDARPENARRWRRAGLLWPLFAKG